MYGVEKLTHQPEGQSAHQGIAGNTRIDAGRAGRAFGSRLQAHTVA